ncbi:MAG: DegT/DnrJ/EryC1/StrS family aminotransferase [Pseudomonadota bacterium]
MRASTFRHIPMLPLPTWPRPASKGDSMGDFGATGDVVRLRSGRLAQQLALQLRPRRTHRAVLVPSYHCMSMIDPVAHAGDRPVFYKLGPDLSPDLDDVRRHIQHVDAMVGVHFFGFVQNFEALRELCEAHSVTLIEDCAHALFGDVGGWGDYAMASLRKFYPIYDGGALRCNGHPVPSPANRELRYELKIAKNTLEQSARFANVPTTPPEFVADEPESADHGGDYLDPRFARLHSRAPMSLTAGFQLNRSDVEDMIARRRINANRLHAYVSTLTNMVPAGGGFPYDGVPYVYLLRLKRPQRDFRALKQLGMPIWRWDTLATDACPVSNVLRESLIQLPCHQDLENDDMDQLGEWLQQVDRS